MDSFCFFLRMVLLYFFLFRHKKRVRGRVFSFFWTDLLNVFSLYCCFVEVAPYYDVTSTNEQTHSPRLQRPLQDEVGEGQRKDRNEEIRTMHLSCCCWFLVLDTAITKERLKQNCVIKENKDADSSLEARRSR